MAKLFRINVWLTVIGAGALFALGWLAGSWTTCRASGCTFDVQLFEAVGTWVGGLGTVLAVVIATHQLRTVIASSMQENRANEAGAERAARRVKFRAKPLKPHATVYKAVGVTVTNTSTETLTSLVLRTSDGTILKETEQVDPQREWLVTVPAGEVDLDDLLIEGAEARVRAEVEQRLELAFDLGGYRFVRTRTGMRKASE